jgi:hypothetical protein
MIKTYQDLNKLVQARRLGKSIGDEEKTNHLTQVKCVILHIKRASFACRFLICDPDDGY